jgi:hypothetical protein
VLVIGAPKDFQYTKPQCTDIPEIRKRRPQDIHPNVVRLQLYYPPQTPGSARVRSQPMRGTELGQQFDGNKSISTDRKVLSYAGSCYGDGTHNPLVDLIRMPAQRHLANDLDMDRALPLINSKRVVISVGLKSRPRKTLEHHRDLDILRRPFLAENDKRQYFPSVQRNTKELHRCRRAGSLYRPCFRYSLLIVLPSIGPVLDCLLDRRNAKAIRYHSGRILA